MSDWPRAPRTVRLLGLGFADMDAESAASVLARRPPTLPFGYVVTPNADHLVRLHRDPGLAAIYQRAALCLLDSRVVAGLARLLGLPAPRVATGSDLTSALLRHPDAAHAAITIIGLRPAALPALARKCGLRRIAHYDPPHDLDENPESERRAIAFVLAHPARFVFLALGSPRQERLAAAIAATGHATGIGLCIGASLDFLSGAVPRAPVWMQRSGLEWLHRLGQDPARLWRRYARDSPPILGLLAAARLRRVRP